MTQRIWGEKYNCGPKPRTHWTLLTLVCIVLCTPAFFYPVVRFTGKTEREIYGYIFVLKHPPISQMLGVYFLNGSLFAVLGK